MRFEAVAKTFEAREERGRQGARATRALDGLDLEVRAGETVCLIGASGCGKTTALRLVNRLEVPTAGRVLVDEVDTTAWDVIRLRRRIGYVIQEGGLFPHLTVAENVGLLPRLEGWDASRIDARVAELLDLVRLEPATFGPRHPNALSGGQRQRVGVARALALAPGLLLMDEPFGALDPITRGELQDEFQDLSARVRQTVILVSHDLDEAFRLGDRVALLHEGRIEQVGTPDELRRAPATPFAERFLSRHLHAS